MAEGTEGIEESGESIIIWNVKGDRFGVWRKRNRLYQVSEVSLGDVTGLHMEVSWNHTEKHILRVMTECDTLCGRPPCHWVAQQGDARGRATGRLGRCAQGSEGGTQDASEDTEMKMKNRKTE